MTTNTYMNQETIPAVSVVIPVYNHEKFVVEALDSVRAQTWSDWELIVIDDGSTDQSWSVLQEYLHRYRDDRIRLFRQSNAGSHATLNKGLTMARSPYVTILNSDDRYVPERLQRLLDFARERRNEVFIVTGLRLIDEHGQVLPHAHWWNRMYEDIVQRWRAAKNRGDNPDVMTLLWGNFTISTSNFFMSRSIRDKIGPFRPLRYVLDWDYALRVAADQPSAFHFLPDEALLDYRLHGENTILGGALHNHAEAYHVLRAFQKKWVAGGGGISAQGIDRLHYLARFIRHEHTRQSLEEQKAGWTEQVQALRAALDHVQTEVENMRHQAARIREEAQVWKSRAEEHLFDAANWRNLAAEHLLDAAKWRQQAEEHRQLAVDWQSQAVEQQRSAAEWKAQTREWQSLARQMQSSRSWRLTAPFRDLLARARAVRDTIRKGSRRLAAWPSYQVRQKAVVSAYDEWLQAEAVWLRELHRESGRLVSELNKRPLISVVMPVHDTPPAFLLNAVESVRTQWYENWELCICDDASSQLDTVAALDSLRSLDRRVKFVRRDTSGHIVHATNQAIASAEGEYLVFLDHDDQLAAHALMRLAQTINEGNPPDVIYSDEDKLDEEGRRCLPLFKPQWSPVLEWSQNYVGHLMCVRRAALDRVGGLLEGSQGSQDHDLVLRLAMQEATFRHIPEVLYHWRMHAASTASRAEAKPYAHQAGKEAVERHLRSRYGQQFDHVDDGEYTFVYQPRFVVPTGTKASIIIPTLDKAELLETCIKSIQEKTVGVSYEILVLDNGSVEEQTQACFSRLRLDPRVRIIEAKIPFNWSRLNNLGRRHVEGELLVFLNNDTEVISPDWLLRLAEYALLPDMATVGPLLLYPDNTIQHAGVVVGMGGWADHVFKSEVVQHYPTPFVSSVVARNVLANTGACMAISARRFDELGGFDEEFEICGSDVEIGIRAHNAGFQNVYLPAVRLFHHESKTRSAHVPEVDFQQSALKYAPYRLCGDPFFNPNLDPFSTTPRPKFPEALWKFSPSVES